jgi:hypothetical protein
MRVVSLLLLLMLLAPAAGANSPPQDESVPTRIDITQHGEPHDAWDKVISLAQNLAWPLTVMIALYLFRGSIR